MRGSNRAVLVLALALAAPTGGALAAPQIAPQQSAASPPVAVPSTIKVHFNQEMIDGLLTDFDVDDPKAVFALVFSQLPATVRVYPTENYYYWSFAARGQTIAGNLRLDAGDRDQGVLHLGYFRYDESGRNQDRAGLGKLLTRADGVVVERRGPFEYAVSYGGRTVRFLLDDLIDMTPPRPASLAEGEVFVGPVFDDSGLVFFLMFDRSERHFFYMLNEDRWEPEAFEPVNDAVVVGLRTGFAFYVDALRKRKILIAVNRRNANRNNYYDGPFDQLPDNFVDRTNIQHYIEEAYPEAKGLVDRFGIYLHQPEARLAIIPYIQYENDAELAFALGCVERKAQGGFLRCLTPDLQQGVQCLGGGDCVGPRVLGESGLEIEIPEPRPEGTGAAVKPPVNR